MKSSEFFNGIIKTINTANKTITPFISDTTAPNSLDGSINIIVKFTNFWINFDIFKNIS